MVETKALKKPYSDDFVLICIQLAATPQPVRSCFVLVYHTPLNPPLPRGELKRGGVAEQGFFHLLCLSGSSCIRHSDAE
jgi:hypothetical protein